MLLEKRAKKYKCYQCGKAYTSPMRLGHHRAAEHGLRTARDIRTTKDIPHCPEVKSSHTPIHRT